MCSPVVWADTQVCPYKMTHDGRNMEQVYRCVTAQVEIIQELFYSDDTESPIIFSNRSEVQGSKVQRFKVQRFIECILLIIIPQFLNHQITKSPNHQIPHVFTFGRHSGRGKKPKIRQQQGPGSLVHRLCYRCRSAGCHGRVPGSYHYSQRT